MGLLQERLRKNYAREYEVEQNAYFSILDKIDNWNNNWQEIYKGSPYKESHWPVFRDAEIAILKQQLELKIKLLQTIEGFIHPPINTNNK